MRIDVEEFKRPCECGQTHQITVEEIVVERGALAHLPGMITRRGYAKPVMLCDENTHRAAGAAVAELVDLWRTITLDPKGLHADEVAVEKAAALLPPGGDVLLAVGSGTVHDIARYIAAEKGLPFFSVPTAASVDGFVSTVAAMTWYGFKKSFIASSPQCVVADSDIFAAAPRRLTASGVSDLLGKYTALLDWEVSHLITGEAICPRVCRMEREAVDTVRQNAAALGRGDTDACEQLMYGLLLSGIAMQMVGNSRPASGAEHHLSHLWEMELLNPYVDALHGEKVGVGLLLAVAVYRRAGTFLKQGGYSAPPYQGIEEDLLGHLVKDPAVLRSMREENTPDPMAAIDSAVLLAKGAEIAALLASLPSPDELAAVLREARAPTGVEDLGLASDIVPLSLRMSPYVRNRLTFLRLCKRFGFYDELLG